MQKVSSGKASAFVKSVLGLKPRVAVFDCDGTLWSGDAGADFFYWEIERGLIPADVVEWALPRYDAYKRGEVDEETMCGEMVTIHKGIAEAEVRKAAAEFFTAVVSPRIFPEMRELTHCLAEAHCELWAVSSTNNWVVSEGVRRFNIPPDRVLAASVACEGGIASDRLVRVPTGPKKASVIRELIKRPVDAAFGNSVHDAAMLEVARNPFVVNPNPDLAEMAEQKGWPVYRPDLTVG
jgi:phosphoserine phosphatase